MSFAPVPADALFMSILAMDSYNRGPGGEWSGLTFANGAGIGKASIIATQDTPGSSFYAVAYEWQHDGITTTVISYRGTDEITFDPNADPQTGWPVGAGVVTDNQAELAASFYTQVTGQSVFDAAPSDVILTGHSLGGGLAGYVASLSGAQALIIDHMPFTVAALNSFVTEALSRISQSEAALQQLGVAGDPGEALIPVLAALQNLQDSDVQAALEIVGMRMPQWIGNISAYHVDGEPLEPIRAGEVQGLLSEIGLLQPILDHLGIADLGGTGQATALAESQIPNTPLSSDGFGLNLLQLHSSALQVTLLYAMQHQPESWRSVAGEFARAWFNDNIGEALGLTKVGNVAPTDQMLRMIAYSAIDDQSGLVFGDTGIVALFNDANELGLAFTNGSETLHDLTASLAQIATQFAGQLAYHQVTQVDAKLGVFTLSPGQQLLTVSFSDSLWGLGGAVPQTIVGRDAFVSQVLEDAGDAIDQSRAKMSWLWGSSSTDVIDSFTITVGNGAVTEPIPEHPVGAGSVGLLVAGDAADILTGTSDRDFIVGGKGADTLNGGAGNDLLAGGAGDDVLAGGAGYDVLVGGKGTDLVDLGGLGTQTVILSGGSGADFVEVRLAGATDSDRLYDIERLQLSDQDDKVIVTSIANVGGSLTVQGGVGTDELDLTAVSDGLYYDKGLLRENTPWSAGTNFFGFGDKITFDSFETLRFGGGADKVTSDVVNSEIYLGAGNDTLVFAAPGSRIWGGDGQDTFLLSPGVRIEDASGEDHIYQSGSLLTGALRWAASVLPYAVNLTNTIGYGVNKAGELVIHDMVTKQEMYVADYVGGPGAAFNRAGIYLAQTEIGAYRLLEEKPAHMTAMGAWEVFLGAYMKANFGVSLWATVDPLALDLDGDGLELSGLSFGNLVFDIDGDGYGERTGWVRGDDGILVLDANNDGQVTDVSELFGGPGASGFTELASHDLNGDGKIDASDAVFANLRVWRDLDGDRQVDAGELKTLAESGVASLSVSATLSSATNTTNHILATGSFTRTDGSTGTTSDVGFIVDNQQTLFLGDRSVSAAAEALPNLKGYGTLPDLRVAMTLSPTLQSAVTSGLPGLDTLDLVQMRAAALPILTAWAEASPVTGRPALIDHDDVPLLVKVVDGRESVTDFAYRQTDTSTGHSYWKLASGAAVHDAQGVIIAQPTLEQMQADASLGGTWSMLTGDTIAFFERYLGESLPLDAVPTNAAGAAAGITQAIDGLWTLLNSMSVRLAMQGPLAEFFPGLEYHVDIDGFTATTARQLIPSFEAIFTDVAGLGSGALARLEAWTPILNIVIGDYHQPDELLNTNGFLFSNIVAAYESTGLSLGIVSVAEALGLPADLIRTGTGLVTGGADADLFYLSAGDQTLSGGLGPDTYVVGKHFGHDVIDEFEGASQSHSEDVVRFADIASTDVTARREGLDLVITVNGTTDELRIKDHFDGRLPGINGGGDLSDDTGVDFIVFADGVTWTPFDVARAVSRPEAGAQTLIGTATVDWLDGGAGDDSLSGGSDADVYVFGRGYGHDVINDAADHIYLEGPDILLFKSGISLSDVVFRREGASNDLIIEIVGDSGSVTLINQFAKTYTGSLGEHWLNLVESFRFDDGTELSWQDVIARVLATAGTDGNDSIFGYSLPDDLSGGKGDDFLSGGNEDDTYRYGLGDGHDVIDDNTENILGGMTDRIVFGAGIDPDTIGVRRLTGTNDVEFSFADGGSLVVKDQFSVTATGVFGSVWMDRIEQVSFEAAPGVAWDPEFIMSRALAGMKTAGADTISGFWRQDRLDGGAGNDVLWGGEDSDTYVFGRGYGSDTVDEGVPNAFQATNQDRVELLPDVAASDIVFERTGDPDDLVLRIAGTDDRLTLVGQYNYTGWSQIEEVRFSDGTVWTAQFMREEYIRRMSTSGDDTIVGFDGVDTIIGAAGADSLGGGDGSDVYVWARGDGADTISEGYTAGDADRLTLMGVNPADVVPVRAGGDVILVISGPGGASIRLGASFDDHLSQGVEQVAFADGTIWTRADMRLKILANGSTSGPDTIAGSAGADTIVGGGGNDSLGGGNGSDTYIWAHGDDADTISEGYAGGFDRLVLAGVDPADVGLIRSGGDVTLTVTPSSPGGSDGGSVKLLSSLDESNNNGVEQVVFDNGTIWTRNDLRLKLTAQAKTAGADTIAGFNGSADTLAGGAGNDSLDGWSGSDTYVWARGDGADTISEGYDTSSIDRLVLVGVNPADVGLIRSGVDVTLTIPPSSPGGTDGGSVKLIEINDSRYGVEQVVFDDGTIWTRTDLRLKMTALAQTPGADTIAGFNAADTLTGGAGNDSLDGWGGSDTYVWARGDGADTISEGYDSSSLDRLVLTGVNPADVRLIRSGGEDIIVTIAPSSPGGSDGGSVKLLSSLNSSNYGVEQVVFDNGTVWTRNDLRLKLTAQAQTAGADTIIGFTVPDTLAGGAGNDSLDGWSSSDTYIWARGDGADTISEGYDYATVDRLVLTGVSPTDVGLVRAGGDVVVTIAPSTPGGADGGSVKLLSSLEDSSYGVEQVVFDNGVIWTRADLRAKQLEQAETTGADTIDGYASADSLKGGLGADSLLGWGGADTLVGGGGADTLTGGAGNDVFRFGDVGDSLVASRDIVADFAQGADKIDLSAIDADAALAGDQAFIWLGTSAFSNAPGQLRYDASPTGARTIFGDVDGNGVADFAIQVTGSATFVAADFLL